MPPDYTARSFAQFLPISAPWHSIEAEGPLLAHTSPASVFFNWRNLHRSAKPEIISAEMTLHG